MGEIITFAKRMMIARVVIHAILVLSFVVSGLLLSLGDGGSLNFSINWAMGGEHGEQS